MKTIRQPKRKGGKIGEKKSICLNMIDHQKCNFSFSTLLTPLGLHKYLGDWARQKKILPQYNDSLEVQLNPKPQD